MNLGLLFTAAGYASGGLVFWIVALKTGFPRNVVLILLSVAFVGGILGAKLVQAAIQGTSASLLDPTIGGRAIFGGLLAGWVATEIAKRKMGVRRSTGDAFALALPAGEAIGRIGCFFNGCCYGSPTSVPWAVVQHGELRHPAQLYSAVVSAVLFCVLWALARASRFEGSLFIVYLGLWGLSRFALEFFRDRQPVLFGLDPMQIAALETMVFGITALTLASLRPKEPHDRTS